MTKTTMVFRDFLGLDDKNLRDTLIHQFYNHSFDI